MAKRGRSFGFGSSLSSTGPWHASFNTKPRAKLVIDGVQLSEGLKAGERGALVFPNVDVSGNETTFKMNGGTDFDPDAMRATILLFDRLDYPRNMLIGIGPEAPSGLEHWSGIQRSTVRLSGTLGSGIFQTVLLAAFDAHNNREEGRWSVARAATAVSLPPAAFGGRTGFKIKLENCLPIPDRSVPYDDVLSYRERRKDELFALRHHLEELTHSISDGDFGGLPEAIAFEKFLASLDDHAKVAREENFIKRLTSLEIKFNWDKLIGNIPTSLFISAAVSKWGVLLALGSAISIESTLGLRRKSGSPHPFEYLFRAGSEM